jgi:two-component system, chemotaxis family, response regulator Rcp1
MAHRPIVLLLVEDNPADVRLAQEALREGRVQNQMHVVGDGEEALAFLRREGRHAAAPRPDLLLLDLNLPKRDGFEVLNTMKADSDLKDLPVVVLTGSSAQERVVRGYNLDARCYIQKPLELERYLDAVRCFEHLGLAIVSLAAGR